MRAFVVEDDPEFRDALTYVLEQAGWEVDAADDGIAALGRIRRVIPDVIVLDLRMPNLDGVEVLKLLRSTDVGRRIPVVVVTGGTVEPSVRALATATLVKPFAMDELLRVVADVTQSAKPHQP
jgi:DNA-binding response OmpR family regulator